MEKRVNKAQLQSFIRKYLRAFGRLTSDFSEENKKLFFPEFLLSPQKIIGVISDTHGVSIEFIEEAKKYSLKIRETGKPIEDEVLPQRLSKWVLLSISGRGNSIATVSLMTWEFQEFCEKNNLKIVGGAQISASHPDAGFVEVLKGGEVRFVDVQFFALVGDKPVEKRTKCLWIFGSNLAEDFTSSIAEEHAREDFNWFLSSGILDLPQFAPSPYVPEEQDRAKVKLEALSAKLEEFKNLINLPQVAEPQLQKFFEENKEFLYFGGKYKKIYPRIRLKREGKQDLIPDFFLEQSADSYCNILDIKLPDKKLLVGPADRPRFSYHVESAIAQVDDYKEYFDDPRSRERVRAEYGIQVYKPNVIVLIGKSADFAPEDRIKVSRRRLSFEVVTFEDIISQMEELLQILK